MIFAILWVAFVPALAILYLMLWLLAQMLRLSWYACVLIVSGAVLLVLKIAGALRARK